MIKNLDPVWLRYDILLHKVSSQKYYSSLMNFCSNVHINLIITYELIVILSNS